MKFEMHGWGSVVYVRNSKEQYVQTSHYADGRRRIECVVDGFVRYAEWVAPSKVPDRIMEVVRDFWNLVKKGGKSD